MTVRTYSDTALSIPFPVYGTNEQTGSFTHVYMSSHKVFAEFAADLCYVIHTYEFVTFDGIPRFQASTKMRIKNK